MQAQVDAAEEARREAEQRAAVTERALAFARANVPHSDDPTDIAAIFARGYDGPLDPKVISEAWAKVSPPRADPRINPDKDPALDPQAPSAPDIGTNEPQHPSDPTDDPHAPPSNPKTPEELAAEAQQQREREMLTQGGLAPTGENTSTGGSAQQRALSKANEAQEQGLSGEEARAGFINELARAALDGDESVLVKASPR